MFKKLSFLMGLFAFGTVFGYERTAAEIELADAKAKKELQEMSEKDKQESQKAALTSACMAILASRVFYSLVKTPSDISCKGFSALALAYFAYSEYQKYLTIQNRKTDSSTKK